MKINKYVFEDMLLYFLILYTSLYKLLPFSKISFLDEMITLLLLFLVCVNKRSVSFNKPLKIIAIYLLYAFIVTIMNMASITGFISELFYLIKVPLVFIVCSQMQIDEKRRNRFYMFFLLANIPSLLMGIWQYKNRNMGWELGLKMRNGLARATGYSGHPIWFAFTLILVILIAWSIIGYEKKHGLRFWILGGGITLVSLILILGTQSRYSIAVLVVVALLYFYIKFPIRNKGFKVIFPILVFCVSLFFGWSIFQDMIYGSDADAVRSIGLRSIPRAILNYPFGSGIGTFGSESSILYNDGSLYETLQIKVPVAMESFNSGNCYESTFTQRIVETGIIGVIQYYYFLVYPIKFCKKSYNYLDLMIIIVFVLNSIMNVAYQLPLIYIAAIAYSSLFNQRKQQGECINNFALTLESNPINDE